LVALLLAAGPVVFPDPHFDPNDTGGYPAGLPREKANSN